MVGIPSRRPEPGEDANAGRREPPALLIHSGELTPGRAYRVRLVGPGKPRDLLQAVDRLRFRVSPEDAAGDQHFPYRRRNGIWTASLSMSDAGPHADFRCPDATLIEITAVPARVAGREVPPDLRLEVEPIAPAVPAELLRKVDDVAALAQERCELLDLAQRASSLVPLGGRHSVGWSPAVEGPRVAFVGSAELQEELSFDCNLTPVDEDRWRWTLTERHYDFLLVEPVLHAGDTWRHTLTRHGRRSTVLSLLERCRELGLPTVLWMRIEPGIYEEFSWLAPHFDHVFAVDDTIQRMLVAQFPDIKADILPPAVQPRLHNPVRTRASIQEVADRLGRAVLLDGWWLAAGERNSPLLQELRPDRLLLGESHWEFSFTRLETLREFRWNTIGCLSTAEKSFLTRHVGAELFLPDETLGSWRQNQEMLRSAACGALALYRNEGIDSPLIEEGLCWHGDDESLLRALSMLGDTRQRAAWRHRVSRDVLEHHSYRSRLEQVCRRLGMADPWGGTRRVACLLVSMRPWLLRDCIERFKQDLYPDKELVIVVHGAASALHELQVQADGDERIRIHRLGKERSLGACLNYAAAQTDAPFWAKLDDDDLYGQRYLSDMMLYQRLADYPLLAKPPAFLYFEGPDELRWHPARARRAWTHHPAGGNEATLGIAGGTLVGKRSVLAATPFSETRRGGSDSDFVRRVREQGHDLLVADPFNFAFFRSGKPGFHTWDTDSARLLSQSESAGNGAAIASSVFV